MLAIFVLDIMTSAVAQMYLLYIVPLIVVGLHSKKLGYVKFSAVLATMLQAITLIFFDSEITFHSKIILACMILLLNILIPIVAVLARINFEEVEHLATFDWLTGFYNRKDFEPLVEMEIRRQKRYGGDFSFAYLDLDDFEKLNATQGRKAGDTAIKLLARVLREHIRLTDTTGRLGGDEFAVMMPNTSENDCEVVCSKLCAAITSQMKKAGFAISASIGFITFTNAPASVTDVFELTNHAMLAAKAAGKGTIAKGG